MLKRSTMLFLETELSQLITEKRTALIHGKLAKIHNT